MVGADDVEEAIDELVDYSTGNPGKLAIFIEGLTDFTDTVAESGIERLVTASIKADQWVVGESETSTWSSAWSLAQPFKSGRRGLLINPGDIEGRQPAQHLAGPGRARDFIPGRGYIVGRGKVAQAADRPAAGKPELRPASAGGPQIQGFAGPGAL